MSGGRKYIPYPFYWDDVPIDISFVFEKEKPAGKHGFLQVNGENLVFADGTKARFWGTNFNSGLNFPSFDFAEKIAKRLAKIGINLVRFHQLDAEWATPNIFQFTKGKRKGHTLDFDPESMKRLDYLIYCLKNEGIYIYLDMLTYRKFKSGDGIEKAEELDDAARPYCLFNRRLIELQKKFNYDLWNHINPYTGLAYKDDPAIALTEIINEGDMFSRAVKIPRYTKELDDLFTKWLHDKNLEKPAGDIAYPSDNPVIVRFLMDVQMSYFREMYDHLREMGVKIPITGTNWAINAANRKTQAVTDFDDGHIYWYGWKWKENEKEFMNDPMVTRPDTILHALSFQRQAGRPYFISEWDEPWPNEWRAESPVFLAAVGSLQNWSGFAIHTYSYSALKGIQITGKEVSSQAIGSVPYREGVFTTWNDPAKFGLFYHSALLLRRSDVKEAQKCFGIKIDDMNLIPNVSQIPALSLISEKHKVGMVFGESGDHGGNNSSGGSCCCGGCGNDGMELVPPDKKLVDSSMGEIISDTGELYRNWEQGYGWIDGGRTKAIYGFTGKVPRIELTGVSFAVKNDFATIALSSLTDKPINSSDNLLLTTVGRSENTGMKFNEEHTLLLDVGRPPILIEVIEAEIKIKTEIPNLKVWAVNAEGFFAGVIPSTYENGILSFRVGEKFPSLYYLIQAE
ncbi:MAG TPA: hypothetical protein GXX29_06810 [Firmicutes bacterium]|nr:hypothetical protein [Bacillota bacterium]